MFQKAYFSGLISAPQGHEHRVLGGFYDLNCKYLKSTALIRNYIDFQGPLDDCSIEEYATVVSQPCHYGGMLLKHFGHFLLESLSRISSLPNDNSLVIFTVRPGIGVSRLSDLSYNSIRLLEHALGSVERVRIITGPCKFDEISFPPAGYIIQKYISYEHGFSMRKLGDSFKSTNLYEELALFYRDRKVWLSRSSLPSNKIEGEDQFEKYLVDNGFLIVKPELISLEEQIAIFDNSLVVTGFTGTAFHPALLCSSKDVHLIHFNRSPVLNNNFKTCLKYSDAKADYYSAYISKKKISSNVIIFTDLYGVSELLLKFSYVSKLYSSYVTEKFNKRSFEREYMLSELFSSYSSKENLKKSINLALKISKKEI